MHIECNYKRSLRYGEEVIVEIQYEPSEAAKLKFSYNLYNAETNQLVASGSSVQVFLDRDSHILQLTNPPFFWSMEEKVEFNEWAVVILNFSLMHAKLYSNHSSSSTEKLNHIIKRYKRS